MGKTVIPLNDTQLKNVKPREKDYTLSDGNGLQLLIKATGTKLWEIYYLSPITLKRRKTSLGNYPNVTLSNARKKRQEYLNLLVNNIDPIEHFKKIKNDIKEEQSRKKNTIELVANEYLETKKHNKKLKDITIQKAKSRLKTHLYEYLPKKENEAIHSITFKRVIEILKKLEEENKLETLSRVKILLIEIFKYAYVSDIIKDTELFGKLELYNFKSKTKQDTKNNPTLTSEEDIKRLYNDILNYDNNLITKYLMIFTIHTAQRQGSIITAKWCNIDFDKKLWIIPSEQMKMKKEHLLPLSDVLVKYLKELYNLTGDNNYLFPNSQIGSTRNKYPHISNNTVTKALRLMNYTSEQQTAHGFRAMFKTVCKEHQEEHNLKNEFVEMVLAHQTNGKVEEAYNRANNVGDMRKIVNWWSEYLENLKS